MLPERNAGRLARFAALLALLAVGPVLGDSPDGPAVATTVVEVHDGVVTVNLSAGQIERLGLRVDGVEEATLPEAPPARARVVDLAPLFELRHRVGLAQVALAAAGRRATTARQSLARLDALVRAGAAVSAEARGNAETTLEGALSDSESSRRELVGLRESAAYQWGGRLAAEVLAPRSELLEQLAAHRRCLLVVAPASGQDWQPPPASLHLNLAGPQGQPSLGVLLDEAPTALAGQGKTWWVVAEASALRPGMALEAVPREGPVLRGARLGDSALLWHAGHRWFYVETGEHRFERHAAGEPRALAPGQWLVVGLAPGKRVVVSGAQSLLGEELRWSIPTEDED